MWGDSKNGKKGSDAPVDTLIGRNTHIIGDVVFSSGLHLEGTVKGSLHAQDGSDGILVIGEGGRVEGEVHASNIIINGTVDGDVFVTEHVELAAKARINGNVHYALIQMAMGAEINGSLIHRHRGASLLEDRSGEADS